MRPLSGGPRPQASQERWPLAGSPPTPPPTESLGKEGIQAPPACVSGAPPTGNKGESEVALSPDVLAQVQGHLWGGPEVTQIQGCLPPSDTV